MTRLRCGGIFNDSFIANFLQIVKVKKNSKIGQYLMKLCLKYSRLFFFRTRCISRISSNQILFIQGRRLTVHQHAAMQQLNANVVKLSIEYLHIHSPKSGNLDTKSSKIASIMSCQKLDLQKR